MSHVVVVTRIYAPEPAAASFRLEALVRGLADAGHTVTVLTTTPRPGSSTSSADCAVLGAPESQNTPKTAQSASGVRVRRARVLRNPDGYVRGYLQYLSFDLPVAFRLLTVRKPDIIVVEPPPTTGVFVRVIAALRRVPYVYYAADLWSDAVVSDTGRGLIARILARVEGWAMRGSRGVIAVLPTVAERVRELTRRPAGGSRKLDVRVVGHGIDTTVFRPAQLDPLAADSLHADDDTLPGGGALEGAPAKYLVYTGTTSSWHGADIFIRALAQVREQIPDLELVYLGHGSQWPELQTLAEELAPGAVQFRPMVPPAEAAQWLRGSVGAIVSLKPGQNYDLAFPTKLYAAVACGVPVVFAGVGPAVVTVRNNNLGHAVDYELDAVAEAMLAVVRDCAKADPDREFASERLSDWVQRNASLSVLGAQAATAVADWARK